METISEVLARMRAVEEGAASDDGVVCFNRLYRAVTEAVLGALQQTSFHDPLFIGRLDVVFAGLYFSALDAFTAGAGGTPRAWHPLFAARDRRDVAPIQFALAGMNAHINRDLMVAIVSTCAEQGLAPRGGSPQHADYLSVNALLEKVEAAIKVEFLQGAVARLDQVFSGVDDVIANWSVVEARNAAWAHAQTLWALRGSDEMSAIFLDTIDGLVGFAGRGLLVPTAIR